MKIVVPYQERFSMPQICCICGAANPTIKYQQSKEARGGITKAHVTIRFMKCQACADELKTVSQTFSRIWTRKSLKGVLIGGGIGLLVGVVIALFMSLQGGGFSAGTTNDIINELIGPFCACASVPGVFGMLAGLIIVKATWQKRIDPSLLQRLDLLKSPVKILVFSYREGWFGGVKNPMLTLFFANDNYGQTFMQLNNGVLA